MTGRPTKGELEDAFTRAMISLEKEYLGRGPADVRTLFIDDMILVRLRGILTHAETHLVQTSAGCALIKETRRQLFESARDQIADIIHGLLDCHLVSLHTDISTKTGERVVVLIVDQNLTARYGAH